MQEPIQEQSEEEQFFGTASEDISEQTLREQMTSHEPEQEPLGIEDDQELTEHAAEEHAQAVNRLNEQAKARNQELIKNETITPKQNEVHRPLTFKERLRATLTNKS